ncbi:Rv1733c family protein [Amycolatopsis sp. TRM77291]
MNIPARFLRLWRIVHPGHGPLVRSVDRLEGLILVFAVLIAMAGLPFAVAAGSAVFAAGKERSAAETAVRHRGDAMLLEAGAPVAIAVRSGATADTTPVKARWTLPDGSLRVGKVPATRGTPVGARVPVWLDEAGQPVEAPLTRSAAAIRGFGAGAGLWGAVLIFSWLVYRVSRFFLDRARTDRWQREWETVSRRWSHS